MEAQKLSKKNWPPKWKPKNFPKKMPPKWKPKHFTMLPEWKHKNFRRKVATKIYIHRFGVKIGTFIRDICFQNQAAWGIHKSKFCIPALSRTSPRLAARRGWQVSDLHWSSTCFVCLTPFPMGNSDQWAKHVNFKSSVSFFLTITQASPFPRECSELDAEEHEDASGDPLHREGLAALRSSIRI